MRRVAFSPYLLAVALTPVFLQTGTPLSCVSGDTTLMEFALIVDGEDQIGDFDSGQPNYAVSLPWGSAEALVHAIPTDPQARVFVDVVRDDERVRYQDGAVGGGDITVPLAQGSTNTLEVRVIPPGAAYGVYGVDIQVGGPACTEQGLRDAIAAGGTQVFDCDTPIVTSSLISISNDVKLDGQGTLVVSGDNDHSVFRVSYATVELRGMTITEGAPYPLAQGTAVFVYGGDLTLVDSTLSDNYRGAMGSNSATLTVWNSVITRNTDAYGGGGIALYGSSLTISDSIVSDNTSEWYAGIGIGNEPDGPPSTATIIRTLVTGNETTVGGAAGIGVPSDTDNSATIIDSTISYNRSVQSDGGIRVGGEVTVVGSTIVGNEAAFNSGGLGTGLHGTLYLINSTVSANHAAGSGGGLGLVPGSSAFVVNTTFTDNTASGGTQLSSFGTLDIASSLVVGDCSFLGPVPVVTNTVEGIPTGNPFVSTCLGSVVAWDTDVGLGPLQDNGGPSETHALLAGSVAIDVIPEAECVDADGEPLSTDQRGFQRDTMCDAGAFEVQP